MQSDDGILWQNGWIATKPPQQAGPSIHLDGRCPDIGMTRNHTASHGLPDYIRSDVQVLFVGINPGLRSALLGHHFAGYSNRFWNALYRSGFVSQPLTYLDDWRLPSWRLGLTNIVARPSSGIHELTRSDYEAGRRVLPLQDCTVPPSRGRSAGSYLVFHLVFDSTARRKVQAWSATGTPRQCPGLSITQSQWTERLLFA